MRRNNRIGFTLVELLVVIGIIAILMGFLLTAVGAARQQAYMVQCGSNERQVAQAMLLRANDSGGYMPLAGEIVIPNGVAVPAGLNDPQRRRYMYAKAPGVGGGEMPVPLPAALAPYMGYKNLSFNNWDTLDQELNTKTGVWKMFMCPSTGSYDNRRRFTNTNDTTPVSQGTMMAIKRYHYTQKAIAAWSTNTDYGINEGALGYHWSPIFQVRRYGGQVTKFKNAAELVLFAEAKRRPKRAYQFMEDGWICWTPDYSIGESAGTGPVTLGDVLAGNGKGDDASMFDRTRHKGKMNVVYADGHVELKRIEKGDLSRSFLLLR